MQRLMGHVLAQKRLLMGKESNGGRWVELRRHGAEWHIVPVLPFRSGYCCGKLTRTMGLDIPTHQTMAAIVYSTIVHRKSAYFRRKCQEKGNLDTVVGLALGLCRVPTRPCMDRARPNTVTYSATSTSRRCPFRGCCSRHLLGALPRPGAGATSASYISMLAPLILIHVQSARSLHGRPACPPGFPTSWAGASHQLTAGRQHFNLWIFERYGQGG